MNMTQKQKPDFDTGQSVETTKAAAASAGENDPNPKEGKRANAKPLYAKVPEGVVPACMLEKNYVRLGILYYICLRKQARWLYYCAYDVARMTGLHFQTVQKEMRKMEREGLLREIPPEARTRKLRLDVKYYYPVEEEIERQYLSADACAAIRARCEERLKKSKEKCNNRTIGQKPSEQQSVSEAVVPDQESVVTSVQKSVVPQTSDLTNNKKKENKELIQKKEFEKENSRALKGAREDCSVNSPNVQSSPPPSAQARRSALVKSPFDKDVKTLRIKKGDLLRVRDLLTHAMAGINLTPDKEYPGKYRSYVFKLYDKYPGLRECVSHYVEAFLAVSNPHKPCLLPEALIPPVWKELKPDTNKNRLEPETKALGPSSSETS